MIKAIFKKQMMEVFSWVFQNKKSGKNRSKSGVVIYTLLYLAIFVCLGWIFYIAADTLCAPLIAAHFGWLYFALMGLIALMLGVLGSVFSTYAGLYQAKDNDFLLSMPVPPPVILAARLSGVYLMGLIYELIVAVPTLIVWYLNAQNTLRSILFTLLLPLLLSVLVLVLSAALGWVVALIGSRLKNKNAKNFIVVIFSLVFIVGYYYLYGRAFSILQSIIAAPQALGSVIKSALYPLYCMGRGAEGDVPAMLIFIAFTAVLFAITYAILSLSFLRLATERSEGGKARCKTRFTAARSAQTALLQKELRRFLGSSNYMLNCGLGILLMLAAAVYLLIRQRTVMQLMHSVFSGYEEILYLLGTCALCLFTSMNIITAPSVSLEGKNLWIVQSFPVTGASVLTAKLKLHLLLTLIPAALLTAAAEWVLRPTAAFAVMIPIAVALFILFSAQMGLVLNLKLPNLHWTNEVVPIKQGMSVMLSLFGGWAFLCLLAIAYWLLSKWVSASVFLLSIILLLLLGSLLLQRWLNTRGARIFESL